MLRGDFEVDDIVCYVASPAGARDWFDLFIVETGLPGNKVRIRSTYDYKEEVIEINKLQFPFLDKRIKISQHQKEMKPRYITFQDIKQTRFAIDLPHCNSCTCTEDGK